MNEEINLRTINAQLSKNIRQVPSNTVLIGNEGQDIQKMYLEYSTYIRLIRHGKSGSLGGTEGFLIGGYSSSGDIIIETLTEAVTATGGEALKLAITEMNEVYPFMDLIGRYICRPGSKGEASEADIIFQRNYFSEDGNALFIFDPINNIGVFYVRLNKVLKRVEGYYLFARSGIVDLSISESILKGANEQQEMRVGAMRALSTKVYALSIASFAVIAILVAFTIYLFARQSDFEKRLSPMAVKTPISTVMPVNTPVATPIATVAAVQPTIEPTPEPTAESTPVPTAEAVAVAENNLPKVHTVLSGESLEKISVRYFGTKAKADAIARANGFNKTTPIKPGQKLKIPQ